MKQASLSSSIVHGGGKRRAVIGLFGYLRPTARRIVASLMSAAWPFFFSHWATSRQIEFDRWSGGPAVPHNSIAACLTRRSPARLTFEINVSELLAVVVAQASCCSTDPLRWFCARCRRRRCAAAWLSYRERNRPPCVAACSWRVLIGKCGPMESPPGVLQSP